jgi:hypothetical protein
MEGNSCDLIYDTIMVLAWMDCGKPQKTLVPGQYLNLTLQTMK